MKTAKDDINHLSKLDHSNSWTGKDINTKLEKALNEKVQEELSGVGMYTSC